MSAPQISGFPILGQAKSHILADVGTALLQIKNARGLTLPDMADAIGKSDDQVARYIAGDMEMGFIAWGRALEAWPELADRVAETAAERSAKAKQRPLDLQFQVRREKAA